MVILLGLVYPRGNGKVLRPLLRTLAWVGSLIGIVGVVGLILTIRDYVGGLGPNRLGDVDPGTFLFVYVCFLVLGVAFGVTAWLDPDGDEKSAQMLAACGGGAPAR